MGPSTKGVVATTCKDVMFVSGMVEQALRQIIRPHWKLQRFAPRAENEKSPFTMPDVCLSPGGDLVQYHFRYEGEGRTLWLFFRTDCDRTDIAPKTLNLSLGAWGHSELYVGQVLRALSMLGDTYIDTNDFSEDGFVRCEEAPLNFLTACAAGLEMPFSTRLERWLELYRTGTMREGTLEEVLGLPESVIQDILNMKWEPAKARLEELALPYKQTALAA